MLSFTHRRAVGIVPAGTLGSCTEACIGAELLCARQACRKSPEASPTKEPLGISADEESSFDTRMTVQYGN